MRKLILATIAVCGLAGAVAPMASAAPMTRMAPEAAHRHATQVEYYWNHHHYQHRHWEHDHYRYY